MNANQMFVYLLTHGKTEVNELYHASGVKKYEDFEKTFRGLVATKRATMRVQNARVYLRARVTI
jgi:hypothetical protein